MFSSSKIHLSILYIFLIIIELSSTIYLPHSTEDGAYNPYNSIAVNIPSRRSGNLLNSIVQNMSLPREYSPFSVKELFCKHNPNRKIISCQHGSYYNEYCEYDDCYKGFGDSCDDSRVKLPINGKCAPNFHCICGECTGCQNGYCRLELCKRNGIYEKKQSNFIGSDYYYL